MKKLFIFLFSILISLQLSGNTDLNIVTDSEYSNTGQIKSKVNYKANLFDGVTTTWHANGQVKSKANYKDGDLVYIAYYDSNSGQKNEELNVIIVDD